VRIHGAAKNWYNGRVSVAVTGWSTLHFPLARSVGNSQSSSSSFSTCRIDPGPSSPTLRSVIAPLDSDSMSHDALVCDAHEDSAARAATTRCRCDIYNRKREKVKIRQNNAHRACLSDPTKAAGAPALRVTHENRRRLHVRHLWRIVRDERWDRRPYSRPQQSISPDHIIEEPDASPNRKAERRCNPPSEKETEFTVGAVQSTFGSWRDGLREAGLNHSITRTQERS